jgi:hypothetical protein
MAVIVAWAAAVAAAENGVEDVTDPMVRDVIGPMTKDIVQAMRRCGGNDLPRIIVCKVCPQGNAAGVGVGHGPADNGINQH